MAFAFGPMSTVWDARKLSHIFGNAAQNLGPLVSACGSEQAAANALQAATEAAVQSQNLTGVFQTVVGVAGQQVTVRGAVVGGAVKIGTAWM
jgi:hypothetical protein